MAKKQLSEKSDCVVIKEFFQKMTNCLESTPDENKCQMILDGIYQVSETLTDPIPTSNFELYWFEFKEKIKPYADQSDFNFYTTMIEGRLNKILAPARAEL